MSYSIFIDTAKEYMLMCPQYPTTLVIYKKTPTFSGDKGLWFWCHCGGLPSVKGYATQLLKTE